MLASDPTPAPTAPIPPRKEWMRNLGYVIAALGITAGGIAAVMLGSKLADAQSDLPGLGATVTPRLFIVLDTSLSMQEPPQLDNQSNPPLYTDDWDPSNPTAPCRSKFCIGKQVMYNLLPSYESLIDMGLGTYYQYWQTSTSGGTTTPANTSCTYDVLAAPNETYYLYIDIDAGSSFDCSDNWNCDYTYGGALSGSGTYRTCYKYSKNVPNPKVWSLTYYSANTGGSTIGSSTVSGSHKGSSHALYSTNNHQITYTLQTVAKDTGPYNVKATGTYSSPVCPTAQTAGATYTSTSGNGCSASNPCTMYFSGLQLIPETSTVNCQYYRYKYIFYAPGWEYYWKTNGGELISTVSVKTNDGVNWCATPAAYVPGVGFGASAACPPEDTTTSSCTKPAGRECLLRWRANTTVGGNDYKYGRNYQHNSTSNNSTCTAPDRYPPASSPWINQPDPSGYVSDWCSGTNGSTSGGTTKTLRIADYYDPTNRAGKGIKLNAWSLDSTGTPSISFYPLMNTTNPSTTMSDILNGLSTYNATNNPMALALPDQGDYTPLYGSLQGAFAYYQNLLANDPDWTCRSSYLMLVTDGEETSPANYTESDIQTAVTNLRNMSVSAGSTTKTADVKTFAIGFGESVVADPILATIARAGGTAVDSNGNIDLTNGLAYSATDQTSLENALSSVLSTVASGTYTRSKPVLTANGNRVYIGYFQRQSDHLEWPGMLDAFDIATSGTETLAWQFGGVALTGLTNINNQTARTLYTKVDTNTGLVDFDVSGSTTASATDQAQLYAEMGTDQATGDSLIAFVRNMSNNAPFTTSGQIKSSRLSDIYHSIPALVDAPPHTAGLWGNTTAEQSSYSQFQTAESTRAQTLYVGANDGVVHAVAENPTDATQAGFERWGFVPNATHINMSQINQQHTPMVDGSFAAEDICWPYPCANVADWRTVLVGTLRGGGASVFALDVTKPVIDSSDPTSGPHFLWNFTDGNMGDTYSTPAIGRVMLGSTPTWAVVVGVGFSLQPNEGNWVYVLDATTGQPITDGTTVAKFMIDRSQDVNTPFPNLPKNNVASKVSIFRPGDTAFIKQAYLGDTQGRISRLFLDKTDVASWAPIRIFDPYDPACQADIAGDANTPIEWADPTYQATFGNPPQSSLPLQSTNSPPPIYHRPIINIDVNGHAMFYLGTGDDQNPTTTMDTNYFYAVRDDDIATACSATPAWVKVFQPGEKVLSSPAVVEGVVLVATYLPPVAGTGCNVAGSAKLYAFDSLTGAAVPAFTDVNPDGSAKTTTVVNGKTVQPPSASVITIPNVGVPSDLAVSGGRVVSAFEANPTNGGQGAWSNPLQITVPAPKVMSWRRKQ